MHDTIASIANLWFDNIRILMFIYVREVISVDIADLFSRRRREDLNSYNEFINLIIKMSGRAFCLLVIFNAGA